MNQNELKIMMPCDPTGTRKYYSDAMQEIMQKLLPRDFFTMNFDSLLPLISWSPFEKVPFNLSFYFCAHFRTSVFHFFSEMISRWLIPGKRTNTLVQYAMDFSLPEISDQMYMGGEVMIRVENEKELEIIKKHLPSIETEIRLGISSYYHAARILEVKGLTSDQKTAMIQENITSLVKHRPQDFDYDIFSEMQHFLVLREDDFKQKRTYRHMARILCVHYLFKKALRASLEAFPERRYISVKLMRAQIGESSRKVLGIAIGISFLRENEILEERHLLNAVKTILPSILYIEGSFFEGSHKNEMTKTYYFEVEKEDGTSFSLDEITKLKTEISKTLKNRIEERLSPLFMPENEEEVMRHILTLSGQVKYVRDLPQVVINFHKQTGEELEFQIVMVRIVLKELKSSQDFFNTRKMRLISHRKRIVGRLRNKYEKEASVCRVSISKTPFLREDHSIDLFKARREIAEELKNAIGDFRDYNGGMITKENELLFKLKKLLGLQAKKHAFLLENFFYSLSPAVMRSVVPPEPLKKLFSMIVETDFDEMTPGESQFVIQEDKEYFYMVIFLPHLSSHKLIEQTIEAGKIPSSQLTTCFIENTIHPCYGLIYRTHDKAKWKVLQESIENALKIFL